MISVLSRKRIDDETQARWAQSLAEKCKVGQLKKLRDVPVLGMVGDATRVRWVRHEGLPAISIGGRWYTDDQEVAEWLTARGSFLSRPQQPVNEHGAALARLQAEGLPGQE